METKLTVHKIDENTYRFNETSLDQSFSVDAYLIIGANKAILFDCLSENYDLLKVIRKITTKPLIALISHGHGDHGGKEIFNLAKNQIPLYIFYKDLNILRYMHKKRLSKKMFIPLKDGMEFDLGDRKVEVFALGGHTPGSMVLLDRTRKYLFSADAVGSGHFWMQIPFSLPLVKYLDNLNRVIEKIKDIDNLVLFPGHFYQQKAVLGIDYIYDVKDITKKIINKEKVGVKPLPGYMMKGSLAIKENRVLSYVYDPKNIYKNNYLRRLYYTLLINLKIWF